VKHPLFAPHVGESISEVTLSHWKKAHGETVFASEVVLEVESDKATVEIISEHTGTLQIIAPEGSKVAVGSVIAEVLETHALPTASEKPLEPVKTELSHGPAVRKILEENPSLASEVQPTGKGGRITKADLFSAPAPKTEPTSPLPSLNAKRTAMSSLRKTIAQKLVHAQHTAAILTTFNEIDLFEVMQLRTRYKDAFKEKNGVSLSFMSFFTRAVVESLKKQPLLNSFIDSEDIVTPDSIDIGIAVGTERGLVVPVLRKAQDMDFVQIEKAIAHLAKKARDKKLSIEDLSGGSFTISNGGTYGSLLSTPILNPPQSGILGMHKIQERPVVLNGKIEIRPMMYVALSYDHRLIDGKEAVTFLVNIKELLEKPDTLKLEV
jgi:2-oxoglutarate dehydrogenase E2 component (dihydrolipoamide succinyltransferase)